MKRFVMLATVLAVLMVVSSPAQAARTRTGTTVNPPKRTGFFARLMELERRKNAAIRRMLGWE